MNELYVEINKKQTNRQLISGDKQKRFKLKVQCCHVCDKCLRQKSNCCLTKIRELKKRISKIKEISDKSKSEITATKIINNNVLSIK